MRPVHAFTYNLQAMFTVHEARQHAGNSLLQCQLGDRGPGAGAGMRAAAPNNLAIQHGPLKE